MPDLEPKEYEALVADYTAAIRALMLTPNALKGLIGVADEVNKDVPAVRMTLAMVERVLSTSRARAIVNRVVDGGDETREVTP